MRDVNGGSDGVSSALETISAAATAIASAESRTPQAAAQKTRWGGCWSIYWCFGSHKNTKRISHAVTIETTLPYTEAHSIVRTSQSPAMAPPSSPASFLQSEPPSATLSPIGLQSLAAVSERPSMFTVGPYAHETQLVSPPVFSAFTTEPSTAPLTPHLTTPSSPEVPFAKLLEANSGGMLPTFSHKSTGSNRFLARIPDSGDEQENSETIHDYRVSFEICYEDDVLRGRDSREASLLAKAVSASFENGAPSRDEARPCICSKEFNFDSAEGERHSGRPSIGSDWWANSKGD